MADTTVLKRVVEPFVRHVLAEEFGMEFESQVVTLSTGGTHEFDAVSSDGKVFASIKSASGKTSGGNNPSGKIRDVEAELYYLALAEAPTRILVLTNPEFFEIMSRRLTGRLAPGISMRLVELPSNIVSQVEQVQRAASSEVSPPVGS